MEDEIVPSQATAEGMDPRCYSKQLQRKKGVLGAMSSCPAMRLKSKKKFDEPRRRCPTMPASLRRSSISMASRGGVGQPCEHALVSMTSKVWRVEVVLANHASKSG